MGDTQPRHCPYPMLGQNLATSVKKLCIASCVKLWVQNQVRSGAWVGLALSPILTQAPGMLKQLPIFSNETMVKHTGHPISFAPKVNLSLQPTFHFYYTTLI
jgi:hypothetical protein